MFLGYHGAHDGLVRSQAHRRRGSAAEEFHMAKRESVHLPLTPDERALLFYYCLNHTVARCLACSRSYYLSELVADLFSGHTHLCPQCRTDLTEDVRAHVYGCATLPEDVRQQ